MKQIRKSIVSVVLVFVVAASLWNGKVLGKIVALFDASAPRIYVVIADPIGAPVNFALEQLEAAAAAKGLSIARVRSLREAERQPIISVNTSGTPHIVRHNETAKESITISHSTINGKRVLLVDCPAERGRMYALLELARIISHAKSPVESLLTMPQIKERPELAVRGIVQFLHNADLEKEWFYSKEYWQAYFAMLAKDRFNSFNLVFAHQTAYLASPYPFFVKVDKYPQVRVPGLSDADRERNLQTLQYISRLAGERGIDFIMGIWEHLAWRTQRSMVEGLSEENVTEYTYLALTELLRACPNIGGIQLRVNPESGISNQMQTAFYRDAVFAAMKNAGRPVLLDLRGWGALPGTIAAAVDSGLPMRLSMKYWAEFMGLPYELAEIQASYSYADFLRYPRPYPVIQQVWSLGSHRLLLWGDPDYLRRFTPTCHLGEGLGFEVCAPLSQKGYGNAPGNWRIFVSKEREYYRWEFERYWLYYLLYGRLTYNPNTPDSVWMEELRDRFRAAAADVLEAYKWGSQILPFLVAYHLSNLNMYIWPEKSSGGLLDFYLDTYASDKARIANITEATRNALNDQPSAKMKPEEISMRLSAMATRCRAALARAQAQIDKNNKEFAATALDMNILSWLADYHAQKVQAGAQLALFYQTGDYTRLKQAQTHTQAALAIWEQLVQATDGIYYPNMVFGPTDVGHWKDNLVFVKHDLARLDEVERLFRRYGLFDKGFDYGARVPERRRGFEPLYISNYSVEARFKGVFPETLYGRQRGYGWIDPKGITAQAAPHINRTSLEGTNLVNLRLPTDMLYTDFVRGTQKADFVVDLPNGSYQVILIMGDISENKIKHGPMNVSLNEEPVIKDLIIEPGSITERKMNTSVTHGKLTVGLSAQEGQDWVLNGLIITRRVPHIGHVPLRTTNPGTAPLIMATIESVNGIRNARLYYKKSSEQKYQALIIHKKSDSLYSANIPAAATDGQVVNYFIEAEDAADEMTRFPPLSPISVHVGPNKTRPVILHQPISTANPNQALTVRARVTDADGLRVVRLHYRYINQTVPFQTVPMQKDRDEYSATIPAEYIGTTWDLMYYIEAVNELGQGTFHPNPDETLPYVVVKINR